MGTNAPPKTICGNMNLAHRESRLCERFNTNEFRVICAITDPYVVHHGALGSYVCVHVEGSTPHDEVLQYLKMLPGVTEVYLREEASSRLELPMDRIGDLVALSG